MRKGVNCFVFMKKIGIYLMHMKVRQFG